MKLQDAKRGSFVTRLGYTNKGDKDIAIYVPKHAYENYVYYINGTPHSSVRKSSTAYLNDDFIYCDRYATPIQKELPMSKSINIIVTTNLNQTATFASEEDALLWITETWQKAPNTKFTMFKPYQTVEPEVPDLSRFIKKLS